MVPLAGKAGLSNINDLGGDLSRDALIEASTEFSPPVPPSRSAIYIESDHPGEHFFRLEKPGLQHRTPAQQAEFAFWLDGVNASRRAAQRRAAEVRS